MSPYINRRRKIGLSLADHCHDKALEALSAKQAAEWITLADALLWMANPDGDVDAVEAIAKAETRHD